MELEGVVHGGVIVLDDPAAVPEGTRVRVGPVSETPSVRTPKTWGQLTFAERHAGFRDYFDRLPADAPERSLPYAQAFAAYRRTVPSTPDAPAAAGRSPTFAEAFAEFRGAADGLPEDLAAQHDHYRLGTPKR